MINYVCGLESFPFAVSLIMSRIGRRAMISCLISLAYQDLDLNPLQNRHWDQNKFVTFASNTWCESPRKDFYILLLLALFATCEFFVSIWFLVISYSFSSNDTILYLRPHIASTLFVQTVTRIAPISWSTFKLTHGRWSLLDDLVFNSRNCYCIFTGSDLSQENCYSNKTNFITYSFFKLSIEILIAFGANLTFHPLSYDLWEWFIINILGWSLFVSINRNYECFLHFFAWKISRVDWNHPKSVDLWSFEWSQSSNGSFKEKRERAKMKGRRLFIMAAWTARSGRLQRNTKGRKRRGGLTYKRWEWESVNLLQLYL